MSHSYRKVPVVGFQPTEKQAKRTINRHFRRLERHQIAKEPAAAVDVWLPVKLRDVSNDRNMPKAPRCYSSWINPKSKWLRK